MNFVLTDFFTRLALQLRQKRTWLLMLLLPAVVLAAVHWIPPRETAAPVQVGVVAPAGDEAGEEYLQRLSLRSGTVVTFIPTEEETARRSVAAGRWDCALILPGDFARRMEELDTRRLITLVTGPASVAYPVVQETAAACLAEQLSPDMAREYLLESGIVTEEQLPALAEQLEATLPEEQRVLIHLETLDGQELAAEGLGGRGMSGILAGVVVIVLLIWVMFAAMDLGGWLETPFALRLRGMTPVTVMLLPRMAAALIPALLSGAAALACLEGSARRIAALIPYLLLLGALALLFARWRAVWGAFPVLMPFVPVVCLVLSPVIFDLSALFPALKPLSACLPVTLYLRAAEGSAGAALVQVGAAALLLLAMLLADACRAGRNPARS